MPLNHDWDKYNEVKSHTKKSKVHHITGHEGPEAEVEEYLYSFFNLSTRWGWVVNVMP